MHVPWTTELQFLFFHPSFSCLYFIIIGQNIHIQRFSFGYRFIVVCRTTASVILVVWWLSWLSRVHRPKFSTLVPTTPVWWRVWAYIESTYFRSGNARYMDSTLHLRSGPVWGSSNPRTCYQIVKWECDFTSMLAWPIYQQFFQLIVHPDCHTLQCGWCMMLIVIHIR